MDTRRKLVELLINTIGLTPTDAEIYANDFIAHGVTVLEWVSVDDRLPEPKENAICINRYGSMMIGVYTEWGWMFPCYFEEPTHWMPMPDPPKGEQP